MNITKDVLSRTFDSINDTLDATQWDLMKPGHPRKIKIKNHGIELIGLIMNHYRSVGWIVRTKIMIDIKHRAYTLEFINPHHTK
jgi:hypothetical protein